MLNFVYVVSATTLWLIAGTFGVLVSFVVFSQMGDPLIGTLVALLVFSWLALSIVRFVAVEGLSRDLIPWFPVPIPDGSLSRKLISTMAAWIVLCALVFFGGDFDEWMRGIAR